jgi:hypothetical protein
LNGAEKYEKKKKKKKQKKPGPVFVGPSQGREPTEFASLSPIENV